MTPRPHQEHVTSERLERTNHPLDSALSFASENALQLSMIGLGVSWLLTAQRAKRWAHGARESLIESGQHAADHARVNPLLVGAAALSAGVGVGLSLWSSRREEELMAGLRTRLLARARSLYDDAEPTPREATRSANEEAPSRARQH